MVYYIKCRVILHLIYKGSGKVKVTRKNIIKTKKLQSKVYKKFKFSIDDILRKQLNKMLYERRKINYYKKGKKYNRNVKQK